MSFTYYVLGRSDHFNMAKFLIMIYKPSNGNLFRGFWLLLRVPVRRILSTSFLVIQNFGGSQWRDTGHFSDLHMVNSAHLNMEREKRLLNEAFGLMGEYIMP